MSIEAASQGRLEYINFWSLNHFILDPVSLAESFAANFLIAIIFQ